MQMDYKAAETWDLKAIRKGAGLFVRLKAYKQVDWVQHLVD